MCHMSFNILAQKFQFNKLFNNLETVIEKPNIFINMEFSIENDMLKRFEKKKIAIKSVVTF